MKFLRSPHPLVCICAVVAHSLCHVALKWPRLFQTVAQILLKTFPFPSETQHTCTQHHHPFFCSRISNKVVHYDDTFYFRIVHHDLKSFFSLHVRIPAATHSFIIKISSLSFFSVAGLFASLAVPHVWWWCADIYVHFKHSWIWTKSLYRIKFNYVRFCSSICSRQLPFSSDLVSLALYAALQVHFVTAASSLLSLECNAYTNATHSYWIVNTSIFICQLLQALKTTLHQWTIGYSRIVKGVLKSYFRNVHS